VNKVLLRADPPPDIRVAIAWVDMLPLDNAVTARWIALTMSGPRVQHFHDPRRHAGAAVAASLGAAGEVAWDVYLFYPPGPGWHEGPPAPSTWAHQVKDSAWANSSHYHRGADLVRRLEMATAALRHERGDT
jgi:hypothetical protein